MPNLIHETVKIGTMASVEESVRGSVLEIGAHSQIDDFVKIKFTGGSGDIRIGERVYLNSGTVLYSGNGITIGNMVLIGPNCSLVPVNHAFIDKSKPILEQRFLPSKGGIVIEDDVWLGAGVTVLDGALIGQGAVVGANSVVSGRVEPYSVNVGNPLKLIRYRE